MAASAAEGFTGEGAVTIVTGACFKDYADGDYTLSGHVDGGNNPLRKSGIHKLDYSETCGAISLKDLAGNDRIRSKRLDISYYESTVQDGMMILFK